ncbi:MAG: COX15/CtaA family protein [Gammaproteobacteria bacterium]
MTQSSALIFARRVAWIASILALCVVMLGAYTRLVDAGLGCPDWPGCYGKIIVPATQQAQTIYPETPLQTSKAWTEMIHRYLAGTLGLLIILLMFITLKAKQRRLIPTLLMLMLFLQAALGMWTVTLKLLPGVVMGHLLGGMTITALLWCFVATSYPSIGRISNITFMWALFALCVIAMQIALGGWVSSNYAGIICPTFPTCQGSWWPPMDFTTAFDLFSPLGVNYQGGVLGNTARVTIHMVHRLGALITLLVVGGLGVWLWLREPKHRGLAIVLLLLLIAQISFGIMNAVWLLPLPIAVAHNGTAALLLLTTITLIHRVRQLN